MTPEVLKLIVPLAGVRAEIFAPIMTDVMQRYFIDTPKRQSAFIAQYAHETGSFVYMEEIASGEEYDISVNPELAAKLGNIYPGDGVKFKGRGWPMLTGRDNYLKAGSAMGLDLINNPEKLKEPQYACEVGGWYWKTHNLNQFADSDKFFALTKAINGGYNGGDDRLQFWLKARKVLEV